MNGRRLAITTGIVFFISLAFPVVAGLWSNHTSVIPRAWGLLDVVVAFSLTGLAILIAVRFERAVTDDIKQAAYRAYRVFIHAILVILVVFFLAEDRVVWSVFLIGVAWRAWLLFYAYPPWLAALRSNPPASS